MTPVSTGTSIGVMNQVRHLIGRSHHSNGYRRDIRRNASDTVTLRFGQQGEEARMKALFPTTSQLPSSIQTRLGYSGGESVLLKGVVSPWSGPTQTTHAVVMTRDPSGSLQPLPIGKVAQMGVNDVQEALNAARRAWQGGTGKWPMMSLEKRIDAMRDFVRVANKQRDTVANLIMLEIGKNHQDAYKEFDRTMEYIEDTILAAEKLNQTAKEAVGGFDIQPMPMTPKGVTLVMGPANYPLNETFTTLIPALLTGNPVICKLPKTGALSVTPLYEAFAQSFPKGTVQFLSGRGSTLIPPLMRSGKIDQFAFIGASGTARSILAHAPNGHILNPVLGMDAKNPAILLPDADLDNPAIMGEITGGALNFNGQRCTGLKALWVPKSKANEFSKKIASAVNQLRMGMPYQEAPKSVITPLPAGNIQRYEDLVADAIAKGAQVINPGGGTRIGTLFKPAVVYPVTPNMRLYKEEQFGPIVPIMVYDDTGKPAAKAASQEAARYLKSLPYRQQASIFGSDETAMNTVAHQLQNLVCRINMNLQCQRGPDELPFVGRGHAAVGVLSIDEALLRFSLPNMIARKNAP